jgi:hypothetical protein
MSPWPFGVSDIIRFHGGHKLGMPNSEYEPLVSYSQFTEYPFSGLHLS